MDSTNQNYAIQREERDQRDKRRLILPENRVFGPPCQVNIDWNAALHEQRLLATLPYPSSYEKAYTKWLQGHRMEPAWTDINFLQRAEWVQFYFDMTTEDLKVKELQSEKIQNADEAEAKEYVQMAQRTVIPLKWKRESDDDTKEPNFYYEGPGAVSNASGSTTADRPGPSMAQAPVYNQFPARPAPSMNQQPVYNQFGPPARPAPSIYQQTVYNQFPVTGPVYMNQYRGPYQGPKRG